MKIRQAPVADLLKYFDELYDNRHKFIDGAANVLEIIDKYYCSLSRYETIMPPGNDFMTDWCDLNHSNNMKNCPNVPGIIIYKNMPDKQKKYAILYRSGYVIPQSMELNYLSYYYIQPDGTIVSHSYRPQDWDGWGIPIRYFSYPEGDYIDSRFWELGERALTLDSFGHDVKQLQALLRHTHPEVPQSGVFEEKTLNALHEVQSWCRVPEKDTFELDENGKKIVDFYEEKIYEG